MDFRRWSRMSGPLGSRHRRRCRDGVLELVRWARLALLAMHGRGGGDHVLPERAGEARGLPVSWRRPPASGADPAPLGACCCSIPPAATSPRSPARGPARTSESAGPGPSPTPRPRLVEPRGIEPLTPRGPGPPPAPPSSASHRGGSAWRLTRPEPDPGSLIETDLGQPAHRRWAARPGSAGPGGPGSPRRTTGTRAAPSRPLARALRQPAGGLRALRARSPPRVYSMMSTLAGRCPRRTR